MSYSPSLSHAFLVSEVGNGEGNEVAFLWDFYEDWINVREELGRVSGTLRRLWLLSDASGLMGICSMEPQTGHTRWVSMHCRLQGREETAPGSLTSSHRFGVLFYVGGHEE